MASDTKMWAMGIACLVAPCLLIVVQAAPQPEDSWPVSCSHNCYGVNTCRQVCAGEQTQKARCEAKPACPKPGTDKSECPGGPEKCKWTTWSEWVAHTDSNLGTMCSGICNRTRFIAAPNKCGGLPCNGSMVEQKPCTKMEPSLGFPSECKNMQPKECSFTAWGQWSFCGLPSINQRSRSRSTQGGSCHLHSLKSLNQTEPCGTAKKGANCTVSDWLEWNTCDKTCGEDGQKIRFRTFSQRATGGFACQETMSQTAACWSGKKSCFQGQPPIDCQYSQWTEWIFSITALSEQRYRVVLTQPANGGKPCVDAPLEEIQPSPSALQLRTPVDCKVQAWSSWESCDKTCGGGQRSRSRNVSDIAKNGGKPCQEFNIKEIGPCHTESCDSSHDNCQLSSWSVWSACTASCGTAGQNQRKRSISKLAKNNGAACSGALVEMRACAGNPDCSIMDCRWGKWADWSHTSATCGNMVLTRKRMILQNASLGGRACEESDEAAEVVVTDIKCPENCIDGKWGQWSEWSVCSKTCSSGYKFKSRQVEVTANACGKAITGAASSFEKCNEGIKCEGDVDCALSDWEPWSECSRTCGGIANRTRHIMVHGAGHGKYCSTSDRGQALSEYRPCNSVSGDPCHISKKSKCEFSSWAPWSVCSSTCMGGTMTRDRNIATQASRTGQGCDDSLKETKSCNSALSCGGATDCQWGNWEEWGACTKCSGQSFRTRKMIQLAADGGKPCATEDAQQVKRCAKDCGTIAKYFCIWSAWDSWSTCKGGSDSCGNGTRVRKMTLGAVTNPVDEYAALAHTKEDCSGSKIVVQPCNAGVCVTNCKAQDCQLGEWGEWGLPSCDGTCSRNRTINVQPNECGRPCAGAMESQKSCTPATTCANRDCELSGWTEWTTCATKYGQKYHHRSVKHHARNEGKACSRQSLNDTQPCLTDSDKVDCKMDAWGPWQACDTTCEGGQQNRKRGITQEARHGGEGCNEPLVETMPCNQQGKCLEASSQDCKLSDWSMWTGCNKAKELQSFRSRFIQQDVRGSGKPCNGTLEETHSCVAPVPCEFSGWNDWSPCSSTCNEGHQMRSRSIHTHALRDGKLCMGDMIMLRQCNNNTQCTPPRDCVMSPWVPWSPCNPSCGRGQKERKRVVKISPAFGGKKCPKDMHEVAICEGIACSGDVDCKWAEWADWDKCVPAGGDCGVGYKRRKRGFIHEPVGNGRECPPRVKEQVVPVLGCVNTSTGKTQKQCCKDGKWAQWNDWQACSATCGGGVRNRTRSLEVKETWCGKPAPHSSIMIEPCNAVECAKSDCQLNPWSSWEPQDACPNECTEGHQTRNRTKNPGNGGLPCQGTLQEWKSCPVAEDCKAVVPAPRDCVVSEWTPWSQCSKTCDGGHMERSRSIILPPAYLGKACPSALRVLASCNSVPCSTSDATNCVWDGWNDWQACANGEKTASRSPLVPAINNGAPCLGAQSRVQSCGSGCTNATYSCGWDEWGDWGECSASCGTGGTRTRMRYLLPSGDPRMDKLFDASLASSDIASSGVKRTSPEKRNQPSRVNTFAAFGVCSISFVVILGVWSRWRRSASYTTIQEYSVVSESLEEGNTAE